MTINLANILKNLKIKSPFRKYNLIFNHKIIIMTMHSMKHQVNRSINSKTINNKIMN